MKRMMIFFCAFFAVFLMSCGSSEGDEIVLRIANSEEYLDDGLWDEDEAIELESDTVIGVNPMVEDFEEWFFEEYGQRVRVEYSTYGSNEELYNQLGIGDVFDLVCPSEYMIMKLMDEEMLIPYSEEFFDTEDENNYYIKGVSPYFDNVFENLQINGESLKSYGAGYMWGNMGIVYNADEVDSEDVKHWDILLNDDYYKRVTMKDGVRDCYIVALSILNADKVSTEEFREDPDYYNKLTEVLNDTSQESVDAVEKLLYDMRNNSYSLETDSGKADLITGKVVANMQWSGDAVYTIEECEEDGMELCYSVPEECSNLWFDGWTMLKKGISEDPRKQLAAEAFVNYISRPDNVIRNMYWTGYTSAISGGDDPLIMEYLEYNYGAEGDEDDITEVDLSYFFGEDYSVETTESMKNGILGAAYPDEDTLNRCVVMDFYDRDENDRIMRMWTNIRCFSLW